MGEKQLNNNEKELNTTIDSIKVVKIKEKELKIDCSQMVELNKKINNKKLSKKDLLNFINNEKLIDFLIEKGKLVYVS